MSEPTDESQDWPLRDYSQRLRPPGRTDDSIFDEPELPPATASEPEILYDEDEVEEEEALRPAEEEAPRPAEEEVLRPAVDFELEEPEAFREEPRAIETYPVLPLEEELPALPEE